MEELQVLSRVDLLLKLDIIFMVTKDNYVDYNGTYPS